LPVLEGPREAPPEVSGGRVLLVLRAQPDLLVPQVLLAPRGHKGLLAAGYQPTISISI